MISGPTIAFEKVYYESTHDGEKSQALRHPLEGLEGITLDCGGSDFYFH